MSRFSSQASEIVADIKSRLGFGDKDKYEPYSQYGEFADDQEYEDYYDYEEYDPYEDNSYSYENSYNRYGAQSDRANIAQQYNAVRPRLVSYDDLLESHYAKKASEQQVDEYQNLDSENGVTLYKHTRSLKVIRPRSYEDAQAISTALKSGDAVVLQLQALPDALNKRILDFTFGAASVLDAKVDCLARKVFAVTTKEGLTETEINQLKERGII